MIKIIRIKVKGFGSIIEKVKYKFDRPTLNIIYGENGAGKSTVLNALFWCLYGQLLKSGSSVDPWEHLEYTGGTYTETKISDGTNEYKVIRCKNYKGKIDGKTGKNQLLVFKNEEVMQLRGKDETQRFIKTLVGYSHNLFKASIIFGQDVKRLMEEDGPAKKKILEEAFEASYISRAKEVVEKRLGEKIQFRDKLTHKLEIKKVKLDNSTRTYEEQRKLQESFEHDKKREIKALKKEINALKTQKVQKEKRLAKGEMVERMLAATKQREEQYRPNKDLLIDQEFRANLDMVAQQEKVEKVEQDMGIIKKEIMDLNRNQPCPTCGQKLTPDAKTTYSKELRKAFTRLKEKKEVEYTEFKLKEAMWDSSKRALQSLEQEKKIHNSIIEERKKLEDILETIKDAERDIKDIDRNISRIRQNIKWTRARTIDIDLDGLTNKIAEYLAAVDSLKQDKEIADQRVKIDKWLLDDPLSNSGLKAYIFHTMLKKLNRHLKRYTSYIGFSIHVYIDLQSARKDVGIDISLGNRLVPYYDLSKGQKQLANMALIFGIYDTVTQAKPINILVLDEVFESLSANNVEKVGNMLKMMSKGKAVHLITHLSTFNPINTYRTQIQLDESGHTKVYSKMKQI